MTPIEEPRLRPSTREDLPFVVSLHHTTLKEYIAPIWGWDEDKWNQIITKWFKPERVEIICHGSAEIGVLVVEVKPDEFFFESISIVPSLQGRGLGSRIIKEIILKASEKKLPIRLDVLKTNERAQKLYSRLGFRTIAVTDSHFKMEKLDT